MSDPVSLFFSYPDFVSRWGLKNVTIASNKDNRNPLEPDPAAVQLSFSYADDEINSSQYGGPLQVPLDFSPNGNRVPMRIQRIGMVIAYSDLYDVRGYLDNNAMGNKLSKMLREAYLQLAFLRAGLHHLPEAVGMKNPVVSFGGVPVHARPCNGYQSFGVWPLPDMAPIFRFCP